jgi:hypothetical protein
MWYDSADTRIVTNVSWSKILTNPVFLVEMTCKKWINNGSVRKGYDQNGQKQVKFERTMKIDRFVF